MTMNHHENGLTAAATDASLDRTNHQAHATADALDTDLADIAALAQSPLIAGLDSEALGAILERVNRFSASAGTVLARAGEPDDALTFILEGSAHVLRSERSLSGNPRVHESRSTPHSRVLERGDCFGEGVLAGAAVHSVRVTAVTEVRAARLGRGALDELEKTHPRAALHLMRVLLRTFVQKESFPSSSPPTTGQTGPLQCAGDLLAPYDDGAPVVGAFVGNRAVSLSTAVSPNSRVAPITTRNWIGRDIFRRSAGLLLLEAAARVDLSELQLGPSITTGRVVLAEEPVRAEQVAALSDAVNALVAEDAPFVEEIWSVDAAIRLFESQGWHDAMALLATWREPNITLVQCGAVYAISTGPMLPSTRWLRGISVTPYHSALLLDFGEPIRGVLPKRPVSTLVIEQRAPRYGAEMTRMEQKWLTLLGTTSVGAFNHACISGRVRELVHISEGFHEKHIAQTADDVKRCKDVRIIAVAGPSSSGKTTFIKRLKIQLEVNGIHPVELSLDDYYKDRDQVARDPHGEQDFEALEALDLELLDDHIRRLLSGERVATARFDFVSGRSFPAGGPVMALAPGDVLLVEGIHGLNPSLFGANEAGVFRVFVHVATSLPFDRLSWLEPADLRLVRRIVRDRHGRGTSTAESLARWTSVRRGERLHIHPFQGNADRIFDSALVYEPAVLKVFAERYLLEVPRNHPEFGAAEHLRRLLDPIVPIHPDHVPPTSILREFIGSSGFSY
jgi:uridine kinase